MQSHCFSDFNAEDTDELVRMWRESFELGVGIKDQNRIEEQLGYFVDEVLPNTRVQVVKRDYQILGFVAAHATYVAQLYVRVGNFGQGIGSALLGLAKEQSAGMLYLHTLTQNVRACRFYEHHGFTAGECGFQPIWQLEDIEYQWVRDGAA